ncbi:MAG: cupin domain-containing protein, partial [Pseudomonadota bacterium]
QEADRAIYAPIYRLLTSGEDSEAWLLDLPCDTGTQRECHFTRTEKLTVLNGRITVRIENEVFKLSAGQQINIAPGMAHTIENHTHEVARILEMRIGKILNDDDRLCVPEAKLYRSTAA